MDKVRFQGQERLDLVDADALQELVYKYVAQFAGGLMGNAGGSLTSIEYTTSVIDGVHYLDMDVPFQWYHSQPNDVVSITEPDGAVRQVPKSYEGQVVSYNPGDEGQLSLVDWDTTYNLFESSAVPTDQAPSNDMHKPMGSYLIGGLPHAPFLWARPYTLDTSTDARREWNIAASSELPISIKTRIRTNTEFRFSTTRPPVDPLDANLNQWIPIARTIAWDFAGGTTNANGASVPTAPYLVPLYVWDHVASYGDYEQQNADEGPLDGKVGTGTARFSSDDGAYQADNAVWSNLNVSSWSEVPPFEGDGAGISHLGRGRWLPPGGTNTPGVGNPASPGQGADSLSVTFPYLGWYDNLGYVPGSATDYTDTGWKTIGHEGFREEAAPWRLGLPQTLYLMRRAMSSLQSSRGDRPWWVHPDGGGLIELREMIDANEAQQVAGDATSVGSPSGTAVDIVAAGRVVGDHTTNIKSFVGYGLIKLAEGSTANGDYVTYTINPGHTILSVALGNLAQGDQLEGGVTHPGGSGTGIGGDNGSGTRNVVQWAWVTRGDYAGNNLTTQFTLWAFGLNMNTRSLSMNTVSDVQIHYHLFEIGLHGPYSSGNAGSHTASNSSDPDYDYVSWTALINTRTHILDFAMWSNRPPGATPTPPFTESRHGSFQHQESVHSHTWNPDEVFYAGGSVDLEVFVTVIGERN